MTVREAADRLELSEITVRFLMEEFSIPAENDGLTEESFRRLALVRHLLFEEGYTITGAKRIFPTMVERMRSPDDQITLLRSRLENYERTVSEVRQGLDDLISLLEEERS